MCHTRRRGLRSPASTNRDRAYHPRVNVGTNANQRVFATLICEATAPFVQHNTAVAGVPHEPNGDFSIDDTLTVVPTECSSPVPLIRNTGGVWFAAGTPALDEGDE